MFVFISQVLLFLNKIVNEIGPTPSEDQIKQFILKELKEGRVIPGYGHAVLRKTDPRYTCQREFAQKHLPKDSMFQVKQIPDFF